MRWHSIPVLAVALACVGCDVLGSGTPGELGEGGFNYECIAWGDPVCDGELAATFDDFQGVPSDIPIPNAIVVGGRFDATFFEPDEDFGYLREHSVRSASQYLLETSSAGFRAVRPGVVALVVSDGYGVADLLHLTIVEPARLSVAGYTGQLLAPGETADVWLTPRDETGVALGGALSYEWTSSDASVVRILPSVSSDTEALRDDQVLLQAVGGGTATVRATTGDLLVEIEVFVDGEPLPDGSGEGSGGDA